MSVSRRSFVGNGLAIGVLSSLLPPEAARALTQEAAAAASPEEAPHDSFDFWSGFYDSVNPQSASYGTAGRGATGGLPDPSLQTQYLHYMSDQSKLRYATDITKEELLDHDGDVAVSVSLSQFRPGTADQKDQASQLRVDATQTSPLMNLFAPLAWTAIASLMPDKGGKIPSLDQLGFKSDQATSSTSHILLTGGTGKLAVNISRAPNDSGFLKVLKVMITGLKMAAPLVTLPAISVPALNAFSEAFAYWEDRTRFIMNGNLVHAIATQQAMANPERSPTYIGIVSGDYVMVPQKHTDELASELPNLELAQGYLVRRDADTSKPVSSRKDLAVPGVTYATMHIAVSPLNSQAGVAKPDDSGGEGGGAGGGVGTKGKGGKSKKPGTGSGSGSGSGSRSGSKPGF
ncbi:MAG: hypothetical protein WAN28_01685 [Terracidiphilus sp.]